MCVGERRGRKSVKKAGYLLSLGEGESPSGEVEGGAGVEGVRDDWSSLIKRERGRENGEGETMFGIEREQTIICID